MRDREWLGKIWEIMIDKFGILIRFDIIINEWGRHGIAVADKYLDFACGTSKFRGRNFFKGGRM